MPTSRPKGATVFAYAVNDPERYGVVEFDSAGHAISLEEKPSAPKSRYAVTGFVLLRQPSRGTGQAGQAQRPGELEITDLNRMYLERGELDVQTMGRGTPGSTPAPTSPCWRPASSSTP